MPATPLFDFERTPFALLCALEIFFSAPPLQAQAIASTPTDVEAPARVDAATGRSPALSGVVNINTAGPVELERLPGIGPARAKAILELRARITRFARLEDLLRVKGIGRATFRKLRPYLALEGETTLTG
jgi:competence protein ComEA